MVFSNTFYGLSGRLRKFITHVSIHSFKPVGAPLLIALLCLIAGMTYGCGEGDSSDSSATGPTAILTAKESSYAPGRMELDGTQSTAVKGRTLVLNTFTVKNLETDQIVFGPVTLRENLDGGPLKAYPKLNAGTASRAAGTDEAASNFTLVSGAYLATLTVEDDAGKKDTTESIFSLEANVLYAESGSCNATCSGSPSEPDQVVCILNSACDNVDLEDEVMDQATKLNSTINEETKMWMQAWGASGGNGTDNSVGGGSGTGGIGGFAQMITSISDFKSKSGHSQIYYYLGNSGTHNDSGGSGGASTMVLTVEPDGSLDKNQIVLIAGGGGGGGEGSAFYSGSKKGGAGGAGGFAYADQIGVSATGKGTNAPCDGIDPQSAGEGGGGTGCSEDVACGGAGWFAGHQGFGGESGGSGSAGNSPGPKGWYNGTPDLANEAGKGAKGQNGGTCDGGGGGGGFGGGSAGTDDAIKTTACLDGNTCDWRCYGGGGGGSYAAASTTTDGDAPITDEGTGGKGEVIIVFNAEGRSECATLNYDAAQSLLTCQLTVPGESTSVNSVDLNTIVSQLSALQVTADTVVWIQVWGARGGEGYGGGASGQAGYAQMITSISDLESADYGSVLYFYLGQFGTHNTDSGGQGGAATILTNENLLTNPSTNPDSSQILMIAGGSGGGGGGNNCSTIGKDGGDGGIAFASTSSPGSGPGQAGGGHDNNGGKGGVDGVGGTGPSHNGTDGYGGRGGDGGKSGLHQTQWVNTGATPLTFSAGEGAAGDDLQNTSCVSGGGGGGGGWGGGGGGGYAHGVGSIAGGGGGGASYSIKSSQTDGRAPQPEEGVPANPNGATGFVQLVFDLAPDS